MQLNRLIKGAPKIEITNITDNVAKVQKGTLFIARKGTDADGNQLIDSAVQRGAVAIVSDRPGNTTVPTFVVSDVRAELCRLADEFWGRPQDDLTIITVVGTNGKTTITRLIYQALTLLNKKAGVIGTLGAEWAGGKVETGLTTPGRIELTMLLNQMRRDGVKYVAIEASAHAIDQGRLQGICADLTIFTNLTQDHLDYFETMEAYAHAKQSYFSDRNTSCAIVNVDDPLGRTIARQTDVPVITYGLDTPSDVFAIDVYDGTELTFVANVLDDVRKFATNLHGKFNVYNLLAVITALDALGMDAKDVENVVKRLTPVKGRYEVIDFDLGRAVVDYAHTPDALQNILLALKLEGKGRLICVFGCGGNRDRKKRAIMGAIAERYADEVIITSDNPRTEDPNEIAADIVAGIKGPSKVIISRRAAIFHALDLCHGDTVLIAGKGAEEYIEVDGIKLPHSDVGTVKDWIGGKRYD